MMDDSIEEWFVLYERDITSFLVYYTGSKDVEDLVQDTFLIAMKKMKAFKGHSHPKTWLITIARNLVIDRYRRGKVWDRIRQYIVQEQKEINEVEDEIIGLENNMQLRKAIEQLSPAYREVVILRGILEYSPKEISEVLGCTVNHVNVTYHRSLKRLRELLDEEVESIEKIGSLTRRS